MDKLPVELIYRIFDHLDIETIFCSIRLVSKFFQSIVITYNRYIFNLNFISKFNFYLLCRLINPQNIISLIFSNNQQISKQMDVFISLISFEKFTRLYSLILIDISENQLYLILKIIHINLLKKFSFSIKKYDDKYRKETLNLLSSIIIQPNLRQLEIDIKMERMSEISWSSTTKIEYLNILNYINIDYLFIILQYSLHLHTLIIKYLPIMTTENLTSRYFPQLKSLTIQEVWTTIDNLELFLLMTPSLIYLKLMGGEQMMNGQRWEEFIKINLSQLKQFEFYFNELDTSRKTQTYLQLIISSFRTTFWIVEKKWFVNCQYECTISGYNIYLYSIPICKSSRNFISTLKTITLSNHPMIINDNLAIMDNINILRLILNSSIADDIQENKFTIKHPMFPKVTKLNLVFYENWPQLSLLQSLSIFIDISRIISITISTDYFNQYNQNTWIDMNHFMEQAYNLISLIILNKSNQFNSVQNRKYIHSILSRYVKHLEIPIYYWNEINMILQRCESLSTIIFHMINPQIIEEIIHWFAEHTINTTCQESKDAIAIWLGKKKMPMINE